MSKQVIKNIQYNIYMLLLYFVSLIIFQFIFGIFHVGADSQAYHIINPAEIIGLVFEPFVYAGIIHFIFVSIIAICFAFNKKIKKEYKYVAYFLPFLTFYLTLPVSIVTCYIANFLNIPITLGFDIITSCL